MGGHNEATPTSHKKIKHEKENRSQKEGLKKTNKEKKKKSTPWNQSTAIQTGSFVTSSHHFHTECVRSSLGCFSISILIFIVADDLHRTINWFWAKLYCVFVSVPALGRRLVDSQTHLGIMVFQTRKVLPILH